MSRSIRFATAAALLAMGVAACTPGPSAPETPAAGASSATLGAVTLTVWETATGEDLDRVKEAMKHFNELHPQIKLNVVGNMTDSSRILAAISAGNAPDVWQYYTPQMPLQYCKNGALTDLAPLIKRDNIDMSQFSKYWTDYLDLDGTQCALPSVADAYGLFYNKQMLADAGYSAPPKTMSELAEMAKKLTKFNADGSIKVAGFVPSQSFYDQWMPNFSVPYAADFFDDQGKPSLAANPAWESLLQWQKDLTDWYGHDKLQRFAAGVNNLNYTPEHAGEDGRLAMWLDGEWRLGMMEADKNDLPIETAPPPVPDDRASAYGSGFVVSNTLAIPKAAKHPNEAWELVKFLATDKSWFEAMVQTERVVPATKESTEWAKEWAAKNDARFVTFLSLYEHPDSGYMSRELGTCGCDILDTMQSISDEWLAGKHPSAAAALQSAQKSVEDQMSLNK